MARPARRLLGQAGRKSIDAVAIFGGLLGIGFAGRGALKELGLLPKALERWVEDT